MAGPNLFLQVASLLLGQLPMLSVYVLGAVLALRWWRRYPRPALLVFLGSSIHLLTTVSWAVGHAYVVTTYLPSSGAAGISQIFFVMAIVGGILHAAGTVLFICAAFAGRRREDAGPAGFPMAVPSPAGYAPPVQPAG